MLNTGMAAYIPAILVGMEISTDWSAAFAVRPPNAVTSDSASAMTRDSVCRPHFRRRHSAVTA
ncbi:MAG: hypothetical protein FWF44_11220 [Defluviitaleaceae bacterium]|nr:hypothetical protein [Defluviitaleaceae bacterium]